MAFLSEEFQAYSRRQQAAGQRWASLRSTCDMAAAEAVAPPICRRWHARPAQFFKTRTDHRKIVGSAGAGHVSSVYCRKLCSSA